MLVTELVEGVDVELMEVDEDVGLTELDAVEDVVEELLEDELVVVVPLGDGDEMK